MSKPLKILLILETGRSYGRNLLRGIAKYAHLNGPWQIELQAPFYLPGSRAFCDFPVEEATKYDGIIMRDHKKNAQLLETKVPIVLASYLDTDFNVPMILTEDRQIAETVTAYYLDRGFKNFAFVGYDGLFWSEDRKAEFASCIEKAGYTCHQYTQPKLKRDRVWDQECGYLAEWLDKLEKPLAVLTCNDDRALQVLYACDHAKIPVPEEVAIVGIDNDEFICTLANPSLSSVSLSLEMAGFEAASILDRVMKGEEIDDPIVMIRANHVVTRQSTDVMAIQDYVVAQAVHFIRKNIRKNIQIDDVLEHVAVSRRTLYDKFKKSLSSSVHQYIKRLRIEYIEHLLLDTDMSISQIAYHMEFSSDDHIASYYRSVRGRNPGVFRNSMKLK
jgi:LacI family transcriptional regulator